MEIYNTGNILGKSFDRTVMSCFDSFYNFSYLVIRDKPYNPFGRFQTEAESDRIKERIVDLLDWEDVPYKIIKGCQSDYDLVVDEVLSELQGDETNENI